MFIRLRNCTKTVLKNTFRRKYSDSRYIVTSGLSDIVIPKKTIPEYLDSYHLKFEKFVAVECYQTKRKYTYGEIRTKSTNLAKSLKKNLKLQTGDVVAMVLPNVPEFSLASLGILKANLCITTISIHFTADEIGNQILDSNAKVVITDVSLIQTVKRAIQLVKKNLLVLVVKTENNQSLPEGTIDFHEFVNAKVDYPDIEPCNPNSTALIPYSSGTTGLPKGVLLSHANVVSNIVQNNHPEWRFKTEASENYQEVLPTMLPLYHVFGHVVIMYGMTVYGFKMITLPKYTSNAYISMLRDNQDSTVLYVVPPIVLTLIARDEMKREYLRNLKFILSGAAPLGKSDQERFLQKFGDHVTFLQGYGLSETSPIISSLFPKFMINPEDYEGSVGKPLVNSQVKIVDINDPKNTPLGPNISGELLCKGPQVMKGYHNRPEETKHTITEDGWCRTGDIAHHNEKGFIFITDRIKELIKVKGNQVAPAEIEAVVRAFPGVVDAAVIGIPDEAKGEVPRAYVVVKDKKIFDTKKLHDFLSEKLAKYKRIAGGIVVVDEIPKTPSGKILRREIKQEFLKNGK